MLTNPIRATLVVLAASVGLAGCTGLGPYGGIGVGVSSGYGGYGYDPYYAGYGYGSGYGYNPYGWYNGYYYPGAGYWVYDRDRNRRQMTPAERAYWLERLSKYRGFTLPGVDNNGTTSAASAKTAQQPRENWSGFNRPSGDTAVTGAPTSRETLRQRVIEQRAQRAQASSERAQVRAQRSEARQQQVQERREARQSRGRPQE